MEIAGELAAKAPLAMQLDRAWFADMTEAAFRQTIEAAIKAHRKSYASGEPARNMEAFMAKRGDTLANSLICWAGSRRTGRAPQSSRSANTAPGRGVTRTMVPGACRSSLKELDGDLRTVHVDDVDAAGSLEDAADDAAGRRAGALARLELDQSRPNRDRASRADRPVPCASRAVCNVPMIVSTAIADASIPPDRPVDEVRDADEVGGEAGPAASCRHPRAIPPARSCRRA